MGVSLEEDQKRKVVELALQAAKARISPQTGYVHCYLEDPDASSQDTIPVIENLSYVYALFRSKLLSNIQEGKTLLVKLLSFEVEGNFPIYLHQYPACEDTQHSSHLLPIFFYLVRDFKVALGEELIKQIEEVTGRIVKHLEKRKDLSVLSSHRLLAFLGKGDLSDWHPESPTAWGEWCICAQMLGYSFEKILSCYDEKSFVFKGKARERLQEGIEPAVTLLDLFMGEYYQSFSKRALAPHPVHLRASVVQPFGKKGEIESSAPFVSLIEEDKRQCLTLYWGDRSNTYSFVAEAKKGSWQISQEGSAFELTYTPEGEFLPEEENVECALYMSAHEDVTLRVNDLQATAFYEKDLVSIASALKKIELQFLSKEGAWIGHISKGNRSFQKKAKNHEAYDWKIGLRTLRRSCGAQVVAKLTVS